MHDRVTSALASETKAGSRAPPRATSHIGGPRGGRHPPTSALHQVEKMCPVSAEALDTPTKVIFVLSDSVMVVLPEDVVAPDRAAAAAEEP